MTIAFFGKSPFVPSELEMKIMTHEIGEVAKIDGSGQFYFTGDDSFTCCFYYWCQKYKRNNPNVRLVYVMDSHASLQEKEQKRELYDEVIQAPFDPLKPKEISDAESYMIRACKFAVIYCTGGADLCQITYHACLRDRIIIDYYTERNITLFYVQNDMGLSHADFEKYGKCEEGEFLFAKKMAVYLRVYEDLLADPRYRRLYDACICYLMEFCNPSKEIMYYEFEKSRSFVMKAVDSLAREAVLKPGMLVPFERIQDFADFYYQHHELPKPIDINQRFDSLYHVGH